jgi:hypothetical protein
MDIYILRDGQETGPFSEETARTLLQQGDVAESDLAWRAGMVDWVPLSEVLGAPSAPVAIAEPPSKEPAGKSEPATPKQRAFLSYFSIAIPSELTRDQAALLVNDAMEDGKNAERLTHWNEERLRLHPELFAADIQAKKENRANHFFELCQTTGTEYFTGITKAHCQVLVGFLDVKFPHWDARDAEAAEHYFFPAVAEKFPQLVNKQWRGRLHYAEGPKVSAEAARKSSTSKLQQKATSPLVAISRGVVLGFVVLGALYLAHRSTQSGAVPAPAVETAPTPAKGPLPEPAAPAETPEVSPPAASALPPPVAPAVETKPTIAQAEPTAPVLPPPTATIPPLPATAPEPVAPPVPPAAPEPAMNTAPMAAIPAAPMAPPDPAMAPMAPPMAAPPMAVPTALDTAPMAALPGTAPMAPPPGTEPPVPVAPPPATMPAPGTLPALPPSLPPEAAAIPPLTMPDTGPVPPSTTASKTNLHLTKPVEIQSTYGKIMLPPGTPVKLLTRQGAQLKVSYQNTILTIPATSTDAE